MIKAKAMRVIDHEPQWWFLLEDDGSIFLDANCNHSFVGYSFMIEMNSDELTQYKRLGRNFISTLASEIQDTAPILQISTSRFKGRDVSQTYSDEVTRAVERWRADAARVPT